MKPEVRSYKTMMKLYVPKWEVAEDERVEIEMKVCGDWYFKNGKFKKADIQNTVKVLVDLISERQGWNDCNVWRFTAVKEQGQQGGVNVTMRKFKDVRQPVLS